MFSYLTVLNQNSIQDINFVFCWFFFFFFFFFLCVVVLFCKCSTVQIVFDFDARHHLLLVQVRISFHARHNLMNAYIEEPKCA